MGFLDKLQFWKRHDDFLSSDDVMNTGIGGEPLPPLDDGSTAYGSEKTADPLAMNDPLAQEPLNTHTDPLTPNPLGDQAKYALSEDPTMPNAVASQQHPSSASSSPSQSSAEVIDYSTMSEEDRLRAQIDRKYSPENLARQEALTQQQSQQSQQANLQSSSNAGASSKDIEIINLKLDALKSEVSSLGHQMEKIERLLSEKKSSW